MKHTMEFFVGGDAVIRDRDDGMVVIELRGAKTDYPKEWLLTTAEAKVLSASLLLAAVTAEVE